MKHPYIPKGCDQQGRYPEAVDAPAPAEAATDLGADEPEHDPVRVVLFDAVVAVLILAAVAMIVWGVAR